MSQRTAVRNGAIDVTSVLPFAAVQDVTQRISSVALRIQASATRLGLRTTCLDKDGSHARFPDWPCRAMSTLYYATPVSTYVHSPFVARRSENNLRVPNRQHRENYPSQQRHACPPCPTAEAIAQSASSPLRGRTSMATEPRTIQNTAPLLWKRCSIVTRGSRRHLKRQGTGKET